MIDVEAGFEVEYSHREKMGAMNDNKNHYKDLRQRCEERGLPCKIVLGQHYVVDTKGTVTKIGRQNKGAQMNLDTLTRYSNDLTLKVFSSTICAISSHLFLSSII